ncbi:uncharacterized protein LOC111693549, partial [Trichogramma pretiosum]|uniref:uncharacterized protein LOC111693549 n=1 Tax=Trichogramma pretiosum TaxID=7493 RepID=UPI000C7196C9
MKKIKKGVIPSKNLPQTLVTERKKNRQLIKERLERARQRSIKKQSTDILIEENQDIEKNAEDSSEDFQLQQQENDPVADETEQFEQDVYQPWKIDKETSTESVLKVDKGTCTDVVEEPSIVHKLIDSDEALVAELEALMKCVKVLRSNFKIRSVRLPIKD